ncbi:MAG: tail fiber domain-containing protein, partial [Bacteroidota bacterium]
TSGSCIRHGAVSIGCVKISGSQITVVGYQAGRSVTTSELVAIGYQAGYTNTTGFDNTFVGAQAGRLNRNGGDNTFMGTESGENNTTGYDNAFFGEESGTLNTTGYENTFIGEDAGFSNTTGYKNVFVGNEAGISADVGYRNVAVGSEAMSDVDDGHHNTSIGDSSAIDIGDGIYNTMIGAAAGVATEWADYNTFVGSMSGWDNNRTNSTTNANRNTYVGHLSGASNREGQDNAGFGAFSGYGRAQSGVDFAGNTNRNRTTFFGAAAIAAQNDVITMGYFSYNEGQYAIGIGNEGDMQNAVGTIGMGYQFATTDASDSSVVIGNQSSISQRNVVGIGNKVSISNLNGIAIGSLASTAGDQGIALGAESSVTAENSVAIGYGTSVTTSNEVYLGNAATTNIGGTVNWTALSDGRFKDDVKENVPGLDFINTLRPVTYKYDPEKIASHRGENSSLNFDDKKEVVYTGFIAQEVEKAANQLNYDFSGVKVPENTDTDMYGIRYAEFVAPLVQAVQELDAKVKKLEQMLETKDQLLQEKELEITALSDQQKQINLILKRLQMLEGDQINEVMSGQQTTKISSNQ